MSCSGAGSCRVFGVWVCPSGCKGLYGLVPNGWEVEAGAVGQARFGLGGLGATQGGTHDSAHEARRESV